MGERSIYTGNMSIGVFNVPISIYKSFDILGLEGEQFHVECDGKIRQHIFCEEHPNLESPVIYTGIREGDVIIPVDSEIRNQVLDRKAPISVVGAYKNTVLKDLIGSGDLVILSTFYIRPQKSKTLSAEIISHGNQMFALLMNRLKANNSFLLVQLPLLGVYRYCAITHGGIVLAFAYDCEIRDHSCPEYTGDRSHKSELDSILSSVSGDIFPTTFSGAHYEQRIISWAKRAYRVAANLKKELQKSGI